MAGMFGAMGGMMGPMAGSPMNQRPGMPMSDVGPGGKLGGMNRGPQDEESC